MEQNKKTVQKKWYAVYTKSRHEKKVANFLSEKGIENFLPLQKTLKQWSDRKKWVEEPLIRSYIFVNISNDKEYLEVLKTDGAVCFITFSGKPAAIPDFQINNLKLMLKAEVDYEMSNQDFQIGDPVMVEVGSLAGLKGKLVEFQGKNKVQVEIDHISQSFLITIPQNFLKIERKQSN